eukprot:scaffold548726_cov14-Prasinocladus_malaysianus.AAC.1
MLVGSTAGMEVWMAPSIWQMDDGRFQLTATSTPSLLEEPYRLFSEKYKDHISEVPSQPTAGYNQNV